MSEKEHHANKLIRRLVGTAKIQPGFISSVDIVELLDYLVTELQREKDKLNIFEEKVKYLEERLNFFYKISSMAQYSSPPKPTFDMFGVDLEGCTTPEAIRAALKRAVETDEDKEEWRSVGFGIAYDTDDEDNDE